MITLACILIVVTQSLVAQSTVVSSEERFDRATVPRLKGDPRAKKGYRQSISDRGRRGAEGLRSLSSDLAKKLRFEEAADALRKSIRQASQKPQAAERERLRRLERAAELKSRSEKGHTLSADEAIELTRLVDGFGTKGDAVPYAEKAVEQYPETAKALVVLAELIKWDQKQRALELLNRAVTFEPNDPLMYVARGGCYFWAFNDPVKAETDFRRAIEVSEGSNASAWAGLGDSLAQEGRRDEAIAAYRKYLSIRPKSASHYDGEIRKSIEMLQSHRPQP